MELRITETIRAPLERVYALSNDIDRAMEWLPAGVRIEKLTEGPIRVGTRYRETRTILGRRDVQVYEVTVADPPRRSEVVAKGARGTFRFRLDYERAAGETTVVTLAGSATGLGCLGFIAAPLARHVLRKNMAADLAGLRAWIERQA